MKTNDIRIKLSRLSWPLVGLLLLTSPTSWAGGSAERAASPEYQERPVLESSLFPSDKSVLGEEAIQKILTSKFEILKKKMTLIIQKRWSERKKKQLFLH